MNKRKPLMSITPVLLIAALMSSEAGADMLIQGFGAEPCKAITDHIQPGAGWGSNPFTEMTMSWVQGFASGVNVAMTGVQKKYFDLSTISLDEQWAYVPDYCRRNPEQSLSRAVDDMMVHRMKLIPTPHPSPPSK